MVAVPAWHTLSTAQHRRQACWSIQKRTILTNETDLRPNTEPKRGCSIPSSLYSRFSLGLPVILFSAPLDAVAAILWSVFRCASPPYPLQPWTSPKQQHPSGHSARPSIPSWARRGCQSHWHLAQGQSVRLRQLSVSCRHRLSFLAMLLAAACYVQA